MICTYSISAPYAYNLMEYGLSLRQKRKGCVRIQLNDRNVRKQTTKTIAQRRVCCTRKVQHTLFSLNTMNQLIDINRRIQLFHIHPRHITFHLAG